VPDDTDDGPTPEQSDEYQRLLDAYRANRTRENMKALERFVVDNRYGNEIGPLDEPAPAAQ
jgi:hypothetical protein